MKRSGILLACTALAFTAGAAEPPERGAASAAAAGMGETGSPTTRTHSAKGGGSKRRESAASRGATPSDRGQLARSNTDRLNSLLSARARGRVAKLFEPPRIGPRYNRQRAPSEPRSASALKQHTQPIYNSSAHAATSVNPAAKGSAIGGPHAAAHLGGPSTSRTANSATIDGTHLHRKF